MSDRSAQIHWMDWGDAAFEEAQKQDKLILLDIGASWCHWCHVMDRVTYSDPEIIKTINDRFIPVRVEGDKRPDIQERYLLGGWPTTAWLLPDGRILSGTTFVPPETLLLKLKEVDVLYHENKELVTMQVASMEAEAEADRTEAEIPSQTLFTDALNSLTNVLREDFDPDHGGFGDEPKFPYPDAVRFAFRRYRRTNDRGILDMALRSLDGQINIYDKVWGGFYRYGVRPNWSEPHYEKLLHVQASAMDNYLEAFQITGDDRYGEIAAGIKGYVMKFLADTESGGFYGSQDADVGSHDPNSDLILGEDYFNKDEADRLKMGIPYVDKTVYTDWNGMMISAFFKLYHVMGDEHARDFALKTIDRILERNWCDGCLCHYSDDSKVLVGALSDQIYFAMALVDAYQTTGNRSYLAKADELVQFMISNLHDVADGGFFFRPFDPHAKIEPLERHKSFEDNASAVFLLVEMGYLMGKDTYINLAERTLRAISYPQVMESIIGMIYGVAIDTFMNHPAHIVIVGSKGDVRTQEMLETSLHVYEPGMLVQLLDPADGTTQVGDCVYESGEEPVAYVCVQNVCRPPVKASELPTLLEHIIRSAPSNDDQTEYPES